MRWLKKSAAILEELRRLMESFHHLLVSIVPVVVEIFGLLALYYQLAGHLHK
ncbi:MAG TPA: hypothetical protein VOA88_15780 [Candidatus Dormibacteraeota bacterium]|nr:hypothetical protein [Candidatus Dormibacteraeota bacterium]